MLSAGRAESEHSRWLRLMSGSRSIDAYGSIDFSASETSFASGAEKAGRESDRVSASHDLEIEVYYDAPREEIFENWIDATKLRTWFAPYGFDVTDCEISAYPGGMWRVVFRSDDGS